MFMFEKHCRLCITDKSVTSTLNHSDSDNIILLDKLNLLAPGLLQINSSLPIGICTTCISQLNQAYKFIKTCLRLQEILNKYLKQSQNGLEQNNAIIDMNDIQNELTDEVFHNTLVNDEIESVFIKQESIQVNFEDDINEEETNIEEECNYSIDVQCNRNVKECLSIDIIDINNEIIEEHLNETDINTEVKSFQCKMCKVAFARKGDLKYHIRTHTSGKPFQCKTCSKAFARKDLLIHHIRTHTGEKPYQCETCKKAFITNGQLTRHIQTHSSEKLYQCETCKKGFARNEHLIEHIRIHTSERPFQCKLCEKAFKQNGHLIKHMRIHTGEKPYQCETCTKAFISNGDLKRHIRTHKPTT